MPFQAGYRPSPETLARIRETKIHKRRGRGATTSGYRGVYADGHKWAVKVGALFLGVFPTAELAWAARVDYLLAPLAGDDSGRPLGGIG